MADIVDAHDIRKRLGPEQWTPPRQFGQDGFFFVSNDLDARVIVSTFPLSSLGIPDAGVLWIHASICRTSGMPSYEDLAMLHHAVWGTTGHAYQVFVPLAEHISIHDRVLHLWGRADGARVLPNFGRLGTI